MGVGLRGRGRARRRVALRGRPARRPAADGSRDRAGPSPALRPLPLPSAV